MPLTAFYDPGFAISLGDHIMPMRKFAMVAKGVESFPDVHLVSPDPATEEDILRVHTLDYAKAIRNGEPRALAESQKFPWSPKLYPSVCLTNGAVIAAGKQAVRDGASAALASGFHHSFADHGEGFCTFNGLIVAAEKLRAEGVIQSLAILDLDLHYGNGTASLCVTRPWVYALSIYGNDYAENIPYRDVSTRHHEDGENHFSVAIPNNADGADMDRLLTENLPRLLKNGRPDLLLYQAGADPLRDDPYSPLNLSHEDLYRRDLQVFEFAKENQLPVAWVLAGGYTPDTTKVVEAHVNTFRAWRKAFAPLNS
ncbi:MAG: histone deacetylase [Chthoniobacterales bacterium]